MKSERLPGLAVQCVIAFSRTTANVEQNDHTSADN